MTLRIGLERVIDETSGLDAVVAIDRLVRGVSAGGIRVKDYPDHQSAALDAAALARAMTLKASLAGIGCGGAKVVVRADRLRDRAAALERLGAHIESRGGALYVGADYGFTDADRDAVARGTRYIDPPEVAEGMARATAVGVAAALGAALGVTSLDGKQVAIQGLGQVGAALARLLRGEGAAVFGYDLDAARIEEAGVGSVGEGELFGERWDAIAPCALGGAVSLACAERMEVRALVGSANHLLAAPEERVAEVLARRGIVHVPDFLANAGAFVYWAKRVLEGKTPDAAFADVRAIGESARDVLARARRASRTPWAVAHQLAVERLG